MGVESATLQALIGAGGALGGPVLSQLFAPEGQELSSFEGRGRVDPVSLLSQANWLNNAVGRAVTNRAASPISLPSSYVQQPGAYCLRQHERILTASLEWVPCGDIAAGTQILAFDEAPKTGGRSWQPAVVTMSKPTKSNCVRVVLDNGESVVTTVDHPWLVECDNTEVTTRRKWLRSDQLMRHRSNSVGWRVLRVAKPWAAASGFNAGWVSGMLDGEGFVSHGRDTWKAGICQLPGAVSDRFCEQMRVLGYDIRVALRANGRLRPINHISLAGDFGNLMSLLGRLRPQRLIDNFVKGLSKRRIISRESHRVVAVEPVGYRDIQSISTTARTYIGEGFLMHNTGGGLPMPIGLVASDPALANPSLLGLPGMEDFAGMFDHIKDWQAGGDQGNGGVPTSPHIPPPEQNSDGSYPDPGEGPTNPIEFAPGSGVSSASAGPRRRSGGGNLVRAADLMQDNDGTADLDQGYGAAQLLLDALREGSTQRTGALI